MRGFALYVPGVVGTVLTAGLAACGGGQPPPSPSNEPLSSPVRVVASGAQFRGTNGLLFGPDGKLYVASVVTPVIAVFDPETGVIEERLGPGQGVMGPDDLAFGPDGSLYWTDILYGEVGRRRLDGTNEVIASLGPGPNPITFADDGRLFVSQCFFDDRLWELDPDGETEPRLINGELGPGCGLNGMDWGSDGYLYGPRWFRGEVARVDVNTGEVESVATGFGVPAAVKFDSTGALHVLDTLAGEIVRVVDGAKEVVGRVQPSSADNLAFSDDDRLFVSSFADGFVVEVLDPETNRTLSPGGLIMPGGVALDATGGTERLWLADFFSLRALDPVSGVELDAERDVLGVSEIGSVMTVHPHEDTLILTTWFDNQVKIWNPQERAIESRFEGFAAPLDALAYGGGIAVAELGSASVLHVHPESPDERSTIASDLGLPTGLATADGDLFVTDRAGGRLLQIGVSGAPLVPPRLVADGLEGPEGIDIGSDGRLYLVEADAARVIAIDLDSGARTVLADGLEIHAPAQANFPESWIFNGIAAGEGKVYVSGDRANVVYEIIVPGL